jgi:hypothetical protein
MQDMYKMHNQSLECFDKKYKEGIFLILSVKVIFDLDKIIYYDYLTFLESILIWFTEDESSERFFMIVDTFYILVIKQL